MKQKLQIKVIDSENGYVLGTFTQEQHETDPFAPIISGNTTFRELIERARKAQAERTRAQQTEHAQSLTKDFIRQELKQMLRDDREVQSILTNFLLSHPHLKVQY